MKKKFVFISLAISLVGLGLFVFNARPQRAAASFNASDIIDDYEFDNTGTMTIAQIDTFLNSFPNSCISWNNHFQAPDPTGYSPTGGYTYGGNVTAGQVIYDAATAYGLNPQVLLATLQKEESLVTGSAGCSVQQYTSAVGYGCPDGGTSYSYSGVDLYTLNGTEVTSVNGTCVNSASKAGFSQQLIHAAWLLKFGEQRSQGNVSWDVQKTNSPQSGDVWNNSDDPQSCYTGPMTEGTWQTCPGGSSVFYDGYTTIDGQSTHMDTGATAALYWYTPHFSGNQNFDTIYQSWFGPTTGGGFQLAVPDNCSSGCPQYVVYDNMKQYVPSSEILDAWGLENVTLTTMPAATLNAIPQGPNLDRLMVLQGTNTIYFVDGAKRYRIPWMSMFNAWNFQGRVISGVSAGLFSLPSDGGDLTFEVQPPGSSTIYMLDGANSSGQTVIRPFANSTVFQAWEGDTAGYTTLDSNSNFYGQINQAIGSTISSATASYNGVTFQVSGRYRYTDSATIASLYGGTPNAVSAATYERLVYAGNMTSIVQNPSNPAVYLIDNGNKNHLLWPNVLSAWQASWQTITPVDNAFLSLLPSGSDIGSYLANVSGQYYVMPGAGVKITVPASLATAYGASGSSYAASAALLSLFSNSSTPATGFVQAAGSAPVYLLDNSGQLRHIEWPSKLSLYGGYTTGVTQLPSYVVSSMATATSPSLFVTDGTSNYVIENGEKWTVDATTQTDWGLTSPQSFTDGTLSRFTTGGALTNEMQDGHGGYYLIRGGASYGTADSNIANEWGLSSAPVHNAALITSLIPNYMLTRFVHSSVSGDNRTFVIDNGNWYNLSAAQAANLGVGSQPVMSLNPADAPNSITDWTSYMVKDASNNYYVIDGGTKRIAPNSTIINQWDNNGSIPVPTVTNGFLNDMPTGVQIERTIKGSGPAVYFIDNDTKEHILYPQTYQQDYAPYTDVSDALVNALPNGPDIN